MLGTQELLVHPYCGMPRYGEISEPGRGLCHLWMLRDWGGLVVSVPCTLGAREYSAILALCALGTHEDPAISASSGAPVIHYGHASTQLFQPLAPWGLARTP